MFAVSFKNMQLLKQCADYLISFQVSTGGFLIVVVMYNHFFTKFQHDETTNRLDLARRQ